MEMPGLEYCRRLPKVELHAHLTGSISRKSLQAIWDTRRLESGWDVPEPRKALGEGTGQDISKFFGHFNSYLYHLISTPDSLRLATRSVLRDFADDGLVYLELRTTPRPLPASASHPELTASETIDLILSVIEEWNTEPSTSSRMLVNLILSIDRAKHTVQQADAIVDMAISLRTEGRPVVGLDIAGDPTRPGTAELAAFRPIFARAKTKSLDAGGLGLTVHFAEMPSYIRQPLELEEMLSWNPDRIGHAIHIPSEMREEIVKRGIAVELCLTCNVLAGMLPEKEKAGFAEHHFGWWWAQSQKRKGISISLGTDDVGVFLSGLSEEYALAAEHFGLGEKDLVRLTRSAAEGAFDKRAIELVDGRLTAIGLAP